jgi:hypothetical protein
MSVPLDQGSQTCVLKQTLKNSQSKVLEQDRGYQCSQRDRLNIPAKVKKKLTFHSTI